VITSPGCCRGAWLTIPLHNNMYTHEKEAADGVGVPGRERAAGEKNIGLTMPLRTFAHMRKKLRVGVGIAWREREHSILQNREHTGRRRGIYRRGKGSESLRSGGCQDRMREIEGGREMKWLRGEGGEGGGEGSGRET
jgi:hypothetical protein